MKNDKLSKHLIINGVFAFLSVVIWIILVCTHLSNYNYLYPSILDVKSFVLSTLFNLFLPVIPLGLSIIFIFGNRAKLATISLALFVPVLGFSYMRGTAEILFSPTVNSYTNDVSNFGVYDEQLEKTLGLNPVPYFPADIPYDVKNINYCYYYRYASTETAYLSISWQYENEDNYFGVASEFDQLQATIGENGYVFTDSYYANAVFMDDDTLSVAYVITTRDDYLPETMEEAISCGDTLTK